MKAIIFSAGLGTRFKPWTNQHPKALARVNGKSLLQRNVEYLQDHGIRDVIVNIHHFGEQVREAIEKNKGWGSSILISDESKELLETGGGLLKAKDLFNPGERFLSCNVDILTDLDIDKLLQFHQQQNAQVSFGITNRSTSRYLLFDEESRLCGWRNTKTGEEKLVRGQSPLVPKAYSCVAVFEYEIFSLMERHGFSGKFSLIDVYLRLAEVHRIMGYDHSGDRLVDVGKPESLLKAEDLFKK